MSTPYEKALYERQTWRGTTHRIKERPYQPVGGAGGGSGGGRGCARGREAESRERTERAAREAAEAALNGDDDRY